MQEVILDPCRRDRVVKIDTGVLSNLRVCIIEVIRSFKMVFAWGPEDMPSSDRGIITHKLSIDPVVKPIQKRKTLVERREFGKKEVHVLVKIGHIQEVLYQNG